MELLEAAQEFQSEPTAAGAGRPHTTKEPLSDESVSRWCPILKRRMPRHDVLAPANLAALPDRVGIKPEEVTRAPATRLQLYTRIIRFLSPRLTLIA
jgi:hypothetical protein